MVFGCGASEGMAHVMWKRVVWVAASDSLRGDGTASEESKGEEKSGEEGEEEDEEEEQEKFIITKLATATIPSRSLVELFAPMEVIICSVEWVRMCDLEALRWRCTSCCALFVFCSALSSLWWSQLKVEVNKWSEKDDRTVAIDDRETEKFLQPHKV